MTPQLSLESTFCDSKIWRVHPHQLGLSEQLRTKGVNCGSPVLLALLKYAADRGF
jgi:hypothetical protein